MTMMMMMSVVLCYRLVLGFFGSVAAVQNSHCGKEPEAKQIGFGIGFVGLWTRQFGLYDV